MLALVSLAYLAWHEWPDERQPLFNAIQPLSTDGSIKQPLEISQTGLHRLDIALMRSGQVSGQIKLRLTADWRGKNEIALATVSAEMAEDASQQLRRPYEFVRFDFAPLADVVDQDVWLWLELDSEAGEKLGVRYLEEEGRANRITLKKYYQKTPPENLALLIDRLAKDPDKTLDHTFWLAGLFVLYAGLLAFLCVNLFRRGGQNERDNIKYEI